MFKKYQQLIKKLFIIFYDFLAVWCAGIITLLIRFDLDFNKIPELFLENMQQVLVFNLFATIIIFYLNNLYSSLWEYASVVEMKRIILATLEATVLEVVIAAVKGGNGTYFLPRSYHIVYFFILLFFTAGLRFLYRLIRTGKKTGSVMLIGSGETGVAIIKDLQSLGKKLSCIIDDDENKIGRYINGVKIVGNRSVIGRMAEKYSVEEIIIAIPSLSRIEMSKLLQICTETGCKIKVSPSVSEILEGKVSMTFLRDVDVNDLLGREPVKINDTLKYIKDKVVLITGGGGSIGSELARQIAIKHPKQLIIVDIYENNAYDIEQELKRKYPDLDLVVLIASVRNLERLDSIFKTYRPNLVYHAAAHKHVPLMEVSPHEAIKNNVLGTLNTVKVSDKYGVERFVLISTDKAVNPTSVMGASKRICEMIIQSFSSKTNFVAVRFGNVLGSNGSVIPLFKKQIAAGGPVTVTDPEIIRYFMTIPEAVSLVLQAGFLGKGGEIFVLKMGEPVKILDLAKNLIGLSGSDVKITFTGLRPGEKLYEEPLIKGLETTEHDLIYIEPATTFDTEKLFSDIDKIIKDAFDETYDIRTDIKELVPTYIQPTVH